MHRVCFVILFQAASRNQRKDVHIYSNSYKVFVFVFNRCQLPESDKINLIYSTVERLLHLDSFYSQVIR